MMGGGKAGGFGGEKPNGQQFNPNGEMPERKKFKTDENMQNGQKRMKQ